MVSTDSCLAVSMNEQVFTTMMSASSARAVIWAPPCASSPIMTSLSTRFLGQPRLTKPIFLGTAATGFADGVSRATESSITGMESLYFSIDEVFPIAGKEPATVTGLSKVVAQGERQARPLL